MIDLFLKFDSRDHMMQVMTSLSLTHQDEQGQVHLVPGSHECTFWELGEIPGKSGHHVNMRVIDHDIDTSRLEPYRVFPQNSVCVWA